MKLVKSLLLGSAAGLVAIAGAQAADLPVKAKPVQYVKICSLYGVGFYYIPGTDMCLKVGGWVRAEYAYGANGNFAWGWANANVNDRTTNNSEWRARGYITADARNQTEYGTVRGYLAVGLTHEQRRRSTLRATRSAPTALSFNGRASRSDWRSRSTTSTACRRRRTGVRSRRPTRATAAGWSRVTPRNSAMACRRQSPRKCAAMTADHRLQQTRRRIAPTATLTPVLGPMAASRRTRHGRQSAHRPILGLGADRWARCTRSMASTLLRTELTALEKRLVTRDDQIRFRLLAPELNSTRRRSAQATIFQAQVNYTQGALRYIFQTPNTNWGKA